MRRDGLLRRTLAFLLFGARGVTTFCLAKHLDQHGAVPVEVRMWRTVETAIGAKLCPVSVPAMLCDKGGGAPALIIENEGGSFTYPVEEVRAEGFGSILVLSHPSLGQARTLAAAVQVGFPIEPRVAGRPCLRMEAL